MVDAFTIVGIGELLWDVFPDGKRLGGAPLNFSYHCHQLGATAYPVSAVGSDELGSEIRAVLVEKGVPDQFVATDESHPTGTVQVTLENGKPHYEICEGVAWDYVPMSDGLAALAQRADAVCYGSLAQRGDVSRATIHAFLAGMRPDSLKVFDINLRQTFFSEAIIRASLLHGNILKLSDEELPVLAGIFKLAGTVPEQLDALREMFDLQLIAYTRGPGGSLLYTGDATDDHPGCSCEAVNTVGAGDSFTAALCMGLLRRQSLAQANEHANRVAAYVCTCDGATPELPDGMKPKEPWR